MIRTWTLIAAMTMASAWSNQDRADTVLLFFYLSDCTFCHQQAADIQNAAPSYHGQIAVHGIALDGEPLEGFDFSWSVDYGSSTDFQVAIVPTMVLYHRPSESHRVISQGFLPLSTALQNIGWEYP